MAEMIMREIMVIEEKYRDRLGQKESSNSAIAGELALFRGMEQRQCLCIHPELIAYIGEELKKEALILKERRKAREERNLLKPPKPEK